MGIFHHELPSEIAWFTLALAAVILVVCWRRAPWTKLHSDGVLFTWLATTTITASTWLFSVKVQPDFKLYLLCTPLIALMFGPSLAILSIAIALCFYTYMVDGLWANLGLNLLLNGVLPALVSHTILRLTQRHLPHNLFVFLFVSSFFGGIVAIASVMFASIGLHAIAGYYPAQYLVEEVLPSALLLAWGEGLTLGMIASALTVYAPAVMLSFDDRTYLARRPPRLGDRPDDRPDFGDPNQHKH